jgi:Uma2 family endonuclease
MGTVAGALRPVGRVETMSTVAKFSIASYDRMTAAGVFEPREKHHVELIRGEVREMSPIGTPHAAILGFLNAWSVRSTPADQVIVRIQSPIQLQELESVPEPDVVWARFNDYYRRHPAAADVQLIVEVSESSLAYDRGEKAALYAEADIDDYWIVNVNDRVVEVYRKPAGDRYRQLQTFAPGDSISPLILPDAKLAIAQLWPA